MAITIPNKINPKTTSDGEKELFEILKAKLPDDYSVYHSFEWRGNSGNKLQGEADFVIFHKNKGLLVIEVKSGIISYKDNIWYSTNRNTRKKYQIKDPLKQADASKFELVNMFNEQNIKCFVGSAVWFPSQSFRNIKAIPRHYKVDLILDKNSISNVKNAIDKAFKCNLPERWNPKLNAAMASKVKETINPRLKTDASLLLKNPLLVFIHRRPKLIVALIVTILCSFLFINSKYSRQLFPYFSKTDTSYNVLIPSFYSTNGKVNHSIGETIKKRICEQIDDSSINVVYSKKLKLANTFSFEDATKLKQQQNANLLIYGGDYTYDKDSVFYVNYIADKNKYVDSLTTHQENNLIPLSIIELEQSKMLAGIDDIVYLSIGHIYYQKKDYKKAAAFFEHIQGEKAVLRVMRDMAMCYGELGDIERTEYYTKMVVTFYPSIAYLYYLYLGTVYERANDYDKAIVAFNKSIELNPNSHLAYSCLGDLWYQQGNKQKAQYAFTVANKKYPSAAAFHGLGCISSSTQEYNTAIEYYTKAIAHDSILDEAYHYRGDAYCKLKRYGIALRDLDKAISIDSTIGDYYKTRAIVYQNMAMYNNSILDFIEAYQLKTDSILLHISIQSCSVLHKNVKTIADESVAIATRNRSSFSLESPLEKKFTMGLEKIEKSTLYADTLLSLIDTKKYSPDLYNVLSKQVDCYNDGINYFKQGAAIVNEKFKYDSLVLNYSYNCLKLLEAVPETGIN